MQIIHQESHHHWIACAKKDSEVNIYDSIQSDKPLPRNTKQVLQNLYSSDIYISLNSSDMYITMLLLVQQTGEVDCGLFPTAFVKAIMLWT